MPITAVEVLARNRVQVRQINRARRSARLFANFLTTKLWFPGSSAVLIRRNSGAGGLQPAPKTSCDYIVLSDEPVAVQDQAHDEPLLREPVQRSHQERQIPL
jgi:hypothetical protein